MCVCVCVCVIVLQTDLCIVTYVCVCFAGYNSMSETNSPRSTTTTGGSSMDTVLEDGDSFLSSLEKVSRNICLKGISHR